jgi:hypothetical protein
MIEFLKEGRKSKNKRTGRGLTPNPAISISGGHFSSCVKCQNPFQYWSSSPFCLRPAAGKNNRWNPYLFITPVYPGMAVSFRIIPAWDTWSAAHRLSGSAFMEANAGSGCKTLVLPVSQIIFHGTLMVSITKECQSGLIHSSLS